MILLALGCTGSTKLPPVGDTAGELQVGVAVVRMPVPLGIGTVGYGGFSITDGGTSPFAEIYPATTRIHGHPEFKAAVISRGEGHEVAFLRSDTIGIFQQFRRAVVLELEEQLGRPMDDVLLAGGTHTHAGPGRLIDAGGPFELIADRFFPEFYERMVDAAVEAVTAAYADLAPGRVGTIMASQAEGHGDRRCEDGLDYTNDAMPLVVLEREGEVDAAILVWAVHGTVLDIDDFTLSQDVSGAIEQVVEDGFDHPVQVLFFNAWAGDVSPSDPVVAEVEGASQLDGYDTMERVGIVVSKAVQGALPDLRWSETPEISLQTHRVKIDREAIGYEPGEFEYEYGGVYCGQGYEADCDPATEIDALDEGCVPFSEEYPGPNQTIITAGTLADLQVITFPGEPGTLLAEKVIDDIRAQSGAEDVAFFGYAQDYIGYSILEEDWWQGGYEAGGSLWGPRQGEYLSEQAARIYGLSRSAPPTAPSEPEPVLPFDIAGYTPWVTTPAVDAATVLTDTQASYGATDTIVFAVAGTDPWLGAPLATLVDSADQPILRDGGQAFDSDTYAFWVELEPTPSYETTPDAPERTFRWSFHMPVRHRADHGLPLLSGGYQLRVDIPMEDGTTATVYSGTFEVL